MNIYLDDSIDVVDDTDYICDVCNENFNEFHMNSKKHKLAVIDIMKMTFVCDKQRYHELLNVSFNDTETDFREKVDKRIMAYAAGDRLTVPTFTHGKCLIKDNAEYCFICDKQFACLRSHLRSGKHKDNELTQYIQVVLDEDDF